MVRSFKLRTSERLRSPSRTKSCDCSKRSASSKKKSLVSRNNYGGEYRPPAKKGK